MIYKENKYKKLTTISRREFVSNLFWLFLVIVFLYVTFNFFVLGNIERTVETVGVFGPIILILAKISTIVFAPLAGAPLLALSGALYGTWLGFLYVFLGDLFGFSISFYLSRLFGRKILSYFLPNSVIPSINAILKQIGTYKGLIKSRILFIAFPEVVSYAAGLTKIRFVPFIVIQMAIGLVPNILLVMFGDTLINRSNPALFWSIIVVSVIFVIIAILWIYKIQREFRLGDKKLDVNG